MTDSQPIACSLSVRDLEQRLAEIAEAGAGSLGGHTFAAGRHVLRFRADDASRERLSAIVEAEAACCSFLDLALAEDGDELVLTITAADDAQAIARQLALAFAAPKAPRAPAPDG